MATPFIDLEAQHAPIRDEIDRAIARVLDSGRFIGGPNLEGFEREMAEYAGVAHAIGVSSGSDALLAGLLALEIGPGDEVITTPFTFCASAEAILRAGATPVFVDIDPATFNVRAEVLEEAVTDRTRAILPVHLYGQCCRMDRILEVANRHDLVVIEDCAQAMGATFDDEMAGSMGKVGCFSFFPTKNLGGVGDGGMITTDDDRLAERIRIICRHGCDPKHHQRVVGGNFRLDALQAAVLRVKLGHLDDWIAKRRANAALYNEALTVVDGLITPVEETKRRHTYNQYTVRAADRARLMQQLEAADIGHGVYYRMPLHRQDAYADAPTVDSLEAVERACEEVISLPIAVDSVDEVVEALVAT